MGTEGWTPWPEGRVCTHPGAGASPVQGRGMGRSHGWMVNPSLLSKELHLQAIVQGGASADSLLDLSFPICMKGVGGLWGPWEPVIFGGFGGPSVHPIRTQPQRGGAGG